MSKSRKIAHLDKHRPQKQRQLKESHEVRDILCANWFQLKTMIDSDLLVDSVPYKQTMGLGSNSNVTEGPKYRSPNICFTYHTIIYMYSFVYNNRVTFKKFSIYGSKTSGGFRGGAWGAQAPPFENLTYQISTLYYQF